MPPLENPKWEMFANGVAQGMAASVAYEAAGYRSGTPNSREVCGARLLRKVQVADRVRELTDRSKEKFVLTKQWVLDRLVENAQWGLKSEEAAGRNVATNALSLVGKELGMFVDRSLNVNVNVDVSDKPVKAAAPEVIEAQAKSWAEEHGGDEDGP